MKVVLLILSVGIGGSLGALARYGVGELAKLSFGDFAVKWPIGTTIVNLLGCLLIGFLSIYLAQRVPAVLRIGIITGFLGALTTFSTFCLEGGKMLSDDSPMKWAGLGYLLLKVVFGVIAVFAGMAAAQSISPAPEL